MRLSFPGLRSRKSVAIGLAAVVAATGIGIGANQASASPKSCAETVVRYNSNNSCVVLLKSKLNSSVANSKLNSSPWFGPDTRTEVKEFQSLKGLKADGVVGFKTWTALGVTAADKDRAVAPTKTQTKVKEAREQHGAPKKAPKVGTPTTRQKPLKQDGGYYDNRKTAKGNWCTITYKLNNPYASEKSNTKKVQFQVEAKYTPGVQLKELEINSKNSAGGTKDWTWKVVPRNDPGNVLASGSEDFSDGGGSDMVNKSLVGHKDLMAIVTIKHKGETCTTAVRI